MRYIPTLRPPVRGSRVITAGSVMNGPASPGQQVCTGSRPRSTSSPRSTISWHAPCADDLRPRIGDRLQRLQPAHLRREPLGRLHLEHVRELGRDVVEPLDAEGEAHAALGPELVDQQRDAREPFGRSNSSAGPPARTVRSTISVTSSCGSTSARDADELALALEQRDPLAQVERDAHLP